MKTSPVTRDDLGRSVIAVPPLCRDRELRVDAAENARLIRHLESGGVSTLLYGGNANLYHAALSEYGQILDALESAAAGDTWVIPSVGPMYGTAMDQAAVLDGRQFPTAMLLPTLFPASGAGVQTAVRHFVEKAGIPAVVYLKDEGYLTPGEVSELVGDGLVSFIKYAIVRANPSEDQFLTELIDHVPADIVVSGIGEQPAPTHLQEFGVAGFTSGCVCVNPALSMQVLAALQSGDTATAERGLAVFKPLEDLRNAHGPIPVLHEAVAAAGIASTGPHLPMLSGLAADVAAGVAGAAKALAGAAVE